MGEHGLGALGVMLGRMDAGAARRTHDHGAGKPSRGAVAHAAGVIEDLVYRGVAEARELDFRNRLQPFDRHAYAHAGDETFGKRCIDYALGAKTLGEAQRGAEHAAIHAHVLAEHDDRGIVLHLALQREIDGFNESDLRHDLSVTRDW